MSSNMRIVPAVGHKTSVQAGTSAPSAPGVSDVLRDSLATSASSAAATSVSPHTAAKPVASAHPLEARLAAWRATQHELKMEGLRRQFGVAEPVKRGMELATVRAGEWRPAALGGSAGVHGDVLEGRDTSIEWEDVYADENKVVPDVPAVHAEMEARLRMGQL